MAATLVKLPDSFRCDLSNDASQRYVPTQPMRLNSNETPDSRR